ncbi:Methylated-DNA--protein-cysteine methyltransferase [Candidatus Izimaplasma bacterium HR1]|uniref:MGMT family protein n=1 Tax=Candidatus Izimoplasma sp. HR1 TaxID=1541959 RepID=UPI0004F7A2AA|nr:Methylated-DNA--protein-cysteine methyltransferase [Candidatus Izimaplasma bacterium HR1]
MTNFTEQVLGIIKSIPYGTVMTYGQISTYAGNPRGARQVSRILSSMSKKYGLPWHRVINSKGGISLSGEPGFIQGDLLSSEGVQVENKRINLKDYQHFLD